MECAKQDRAQSGPLEEGRELGFRENAACAMAQLDAPHGAVRTEFTNIRREVRARRWSLGRGSS